jgi:3-phosphoshikimate 1-carboxyvinyltransferase
VIVERASCLKGNVHVPGDKSIAHRALILGTLARGKHVVTGIPHAQDVFSTISCLQSLGAFIEEMPDGRTLVMSRQFLSRQTLDAGNSGTTARLLSGLIAGHGIEATLDGDESLRRRPMNRIADPLEQMGAGVKTAPEGRLPIVIHGGNLTGIRYRLPVPSAQVKSAILIAGLLAEGDTTVEEVVPSRDHTERLFAAMQASITRDGSNITVRRSGLKAALVNVPGDFSSAAFFIVAATCLGGSEIYLSRTGVNPTRTGMLDVLGRMGANVEIVNRESLLEEPAADIVVRSKPLGGTTIGADVIPTLIDELPILAVAATQAEGETVVSGAQELRHKESDRIGAIVDNLKRLGADIEAREDGFVVRGPVRLKGATVSSYGDHRIAMAMAVAGLLADGRTEIEDSDVVDVSYPSFYNDLQAVAR